MALEEVVLWMAFVGGVLGAVSFVWQVYNFYAARQESGHRALNAKVLKPWGELRIEHRWGQGQANVIALAVPKEALPPDVAPGREGLDVHALPGLERGVAFLREHYPRAHERWQEVERLWRRYEDLRARRRALVEPWIRERMAAEFPRLTPARHSWTEKDTYVFDNLIAFVESKGWNIAYRGEAEGALYINKAPTQSGETMYYELRGHEGGTLVHTYDEAIADADAMKRVVLSCLERPEVQQLNEELVACFRELEKAIEAFRSELREVAVAVDVAGG